MYQQLIPLVAQLIGAQNMAPVVNEMVMGAKRFMGDALESFEVSNPDEVLSALTLLEQMLPDARDLGGLEDFERAEATAKILEGVGRVENLLRQAETASGRGPGLLSGSRSSGPNDANSGSIEGATASMFLS